MMQWLPRYRDIYKPKWFDNPVRRWDSKLKNRKFMHRADDPLFFDHEQFKINGGIQTVSKIREFEIIFVYFHFNTLCFVFVL